MSGQGSHEGTLERVLLERDRDTSVVIAAPGEVGAVRAADSAPRWIAAALGIVVAVWCVARVGWLATSPPGLSMDEALAGVHVQCLAETGQSADGEAWPFFATGLGGGLYTPTYLMSLFAWTRLFGNSIASIRGMGAAYSLLAVAGLWLLVRRLAERRTAALVVLAAALSPWSFTLSRMGADAPIAPAFLVLGAYFFLRSTCRTSASLGGLFFALAAYSYPPMRLQVPLVVLLLLFIERRHLSVKRLGTFLGAGFAAAVPLLWLIANGRLMGRASALSIFNLDYIEGHRAGRWRPLFVIGQAFDNLFEHVRPSYLLFTGDPNLRHSTQRIGELGWLDTFAMVIAFAALIGLVVRALRGCSVQVDKKELPLSRMTAAAWAAAVFGTLPAALCWEGLPHAYRSIGSYPAVALFTGAMLSMVWNRHRLVPVVVLMLAIGQSVTFFPDYFGPYRARAADAFDADLRSAAEAHDKSRFDLLAKRYPALGFRYYLMRDFGYSCVSSRVEAKRIRGLK